MNTTKQRYVKKPIPIDAFQWDGDVKNLEKNVGKDIYSNFSTGDLLLIQTLEGVEQCPIGDYIVKGVDGEYYPCDPKIFEKTYRLADVKEG